MLTGLLAGFSRSGSNSLVIGPSRSAGGAAMLAADPHLSVSLPNLWVLAGVRSPSVTAVGLMPAGLPIFGLGRSAHMAWGGTNMRAAASDLYDMTREPEAAITAREERIRTRLAPTKRITVRETRLGPLISDGLHFKAFPGERVALRWAGREPSDEIGAFLGVTRARTPDEFRAALASYSVGGQNMQFADTAGNIGQVMAVWVPRRRRMRPARMVLDPDDPADQWQGLATAADLPWGLNPAEGFIASANNPPTVTDLPVSFFFITSERVERLQALLRARDRLTLEDLRDIQNDVTSPASLRLKDQLVAAIEEAGLTDVAADFVTRLRGWDGRYAAEDRGPVAFEMLLCHVIERLQGPKPVQRRDWNSLVTYARADLDALPEPARRAILRAAIVAAAKDAARFLNWGAMHRMRVQHPVARIPVVGRMFRYGEYAASGSRETVMKAAHGLVRKRHAVTYGSQARFLADMGDPDASWAVLLGGQDGWLGSANFADQMPLWRNRGYIRLPMTPAVIEQEFPIVQTLEPQ